MGINNELLRKIDQGYLKFSKGQKKLADYIRKNYDKAAFLTAAKMGEVVASVNRQWCVLPQPWDIRDIRNFKKRWKNLSVQD